MNFNAFLKYFLNYKVYQKMLGYIKNVYNNLLQNWFLQHVFYAERIKNYTI